MLIAVVHLWYQRTPARDDVRAKLRSSIKRLLVKHGYPPDQQPAAIRQVMDQMESMAPRYATDRYQALSV